MITVELYFQGLVTHLELYQTEQEFKELISQSEVFCSALQGLARVNNLPAIVELYHEANRVADKNEKQSNNQSLLTKLIVLKTYLSVVDKHIKSRCGENHQEQSPLPQTVEAVDRLLELAQGDR